LFYVVKQVHLRTYGVIPLSIVSTVSSRGVN